ncbi:ATP-binding protein [Kitasatospora sp. NPDC057223]|uniref:ATP-binding protein n=1 Tax=Kitasatospora sp. NPDC057223 TaxID=3346055 RepID=UPI003628CF11
MTELAMVAELAPKGFHGCSWTLLGVPEAAGQARLLVTQTLNSWIMPAPAADAELLVSELVTNVVRHTGCRYVGLSVLHQASGSLRIEVRDSSASLPCLLSSVPLADSGRGLLLVGTLGRTWGVTAAPLGKIVWVELSATLPARTRCRRCPPPDPPPPLTPPDRGPFPGTYPRITAPKAGGPAALPITGQPEDDTAT